MGRATPLRFAREAAKVLLVARRAVPLAALAQEIEERGGEAAVATADLATPAGAAAMAQAALDRWGRIQVRFDNLGDDAYGGQKLHETAPEEWRYLISINVDTACYCAHAVLPPMVAQGDACILLVSAALRTRREANVGYAAGKVLLVGLTRTLAREYREYGVRVNCICTGAIERYARRVKTRACRRQRSAVTAIRPTWRIPPCTLPPMNRPGSPDSAWTLTAAIRFRDPEQSAYRRLLSAWQAALNYWADVVRSPDNLSAELREGLLVCFLPGLP